MLAAYLNRTLKQGRRLIKESRHVIRKGLKEGKLTDAAATKLEDQIKALEAAIQQQDIGLVEVIGEKLLGELEKVYPRKSLIREYAEAIVVALVLALLIRTFIVQAFKIPSGSMIPTLDIGDHLLVNKFLYGTAVPFKDMKILPIRQPERGDIIVFKYPEDESRDFIKRVVGVAGDRVEIRDKVVHVNGVAQNEPFVIHRDLNIFPAGLQPRDNLGPIIVPPGKVFAMGDNRDQSYDSRFWGFVDTVKIKGKAFIIYWSWNGEDHWVRWGRIGQLIH